MYKGQVAIVGASVGVPVGNWSLVYGTITDICPSVCHTVVDVDGEEVIVPSGQVQLVDVNLAGSTLTDMDENKRAVFHTLWANYWIKLQAKVDGVWEDITPELRQSAFSDLNQDVMLRVKPSDAMLKEHRAEVFRKINEMKKQREVTEEMVKKLVDAINQSIADQEVLQESLVDLH